MYQRPFESAVHAEARCIPAYRGLTQRGYPVTADGHFLDNWFRYNGAWVWWKRVGDRALFMIQPLGDSR
ncbi:hypothetical protein [uncultured Meiothermus sp.]|uniref:hypothetical protein n=1 Tax=uncultured Meiothermus sp. TaxID=157471 RepID=UPI00261A8DAE|nr:hypothetical protein [uncultured Meiothermus sp.]